MLRILFLFVVSLFASDLTAENSPPIDIPATGMLTNVDVEPSCMIDGCINIISGEFIDHEVDLTLPGPEPLTLERTLRNNNLHPKYSLQRIGWQESDDVAVRVNNSNEVSMDYSGEYQGGDGEYLYFVLRRKKGGNHALAHFEPSILRYGFTNTSRGVIGASTNVRNSFMEWSKKSKTCNVTKGDGTFMHFASRDKGSDKERYLLIDDIRPNYLKFFYNYGKDPHSERPISKTLQNYAGRNLSSYTWEYSNYHRVCTACDGRQVTYRYHHLPIQGVMWEELNNYSNYSFHHLCLTHVDRSDAPSIVYEYLPGKKHVVDKKPPRDPTRIPDVHEYPKLVRKSYPDHRFIMLSYYQVGMNSIDGRACPIDIGSPQLCKVHALYAPLGCDVNPIAKYQFDYYLPQGIGGAGCTGVYDAKGNLTNYAYNERKRLTAIVKYSPGKVPYTIENLHWGKEDTPHEIELHARTFGLHGSPYKAFCKLFTYSGRGDILEERLYGNLTGKTTSQLTVDGRGRPTDPGFEHLLKSYAYSNDGYNLLLKRKKGSIEERFVYIPRTTLLTASYQASSTGIFLRHFYDYNDMGVIIRHIADDGSGERRDDLTSVTERKIETIERSNTYPFGLPISVREHYLDLETKEEKLHYRRQNTFDTLGRLVKQETYDAKDAFAYAEEWGYDAHGNCLKKVDPLGNVTTYSYDLNDNKIFEQGANGELQKYFTYDFMNRLVETREVHPDGALSTKARYDLFGNPIASIDAFGNETTTEYDPFHRPIKVTGAPIMDAAGRLYKPETRYEFDELSRPIKMIDPEGNSTEFKYTLYGKPYLILYPDGSKEHFEYDLEGRLTKEVAKNGLTNIYQLDDLGRITKKQSFSKEGELLVETEASYNALHLLFEKDPAGTYTFYAYDSLGRKTSVKIGERITSYRYDALDRVMEVLGPETRTSYTYDALGRVMEERVETPEGELVSEVHYAYDLEGHKTKIEQKRENDILVTQLIYDTHGLPSVAIDPKGNKTRSRLILDYVNESGQRVPCVETIDPLGQVTLQIQDAQGRTVEVEKKSSYGELIQKASYAFDSSGKLLKTTHTLFNGKEEARELTHLFEYDSLHRPTLFIEAKGTSEERQTRIRYNEAGEKTSINKPTGVTLFYSYDSLGRLAEFTSSDHSFGYRYHYDANSRPIRVEDLLFASTTEREYDIYGEVLQEALGNGLSINYAYSLGGHLAKLTLPDHTSIAYAYQGGRLKSIERQDPDKNPLYTHLYNAYDIGGEIKESSLIFGLGPISHRYSPNGEVESIASSYYKEEMIDYDASGNLTKRTYTDSLGREDDVYAYDPLYQLASEAGSFSHFYAHDSLYRRTSKNGQEHALNGLGELLSDQESHYSYDASGNLIRIEGTDRTSSFTYDALDRLTAWVDGETRYIFRYDENNRCLFQSIAQDSSPPKTEKILYAGQNDIGTVDKEGKISHLRILGIGLGGEIGASVAIEIRGATYAPLHDHNGHIVALIDERGEVAETYRYSAFGEESIYNSRGDLVNLSLVDNPWRFSSKRSINGFSLFGRRFYIPSLGRWLTPDPIGYEAGPNLYAYVSNNPLTHFDIYGLIGEERATFWEQAKDYVTRAFESVREGARMVYEKTRDVLHKAGGYFKEIARDAIPLPIVKDVGCALGHFLQHGTLRGYTPSWSGSHSKYIQNDARPFLRPQVAIGSINGMKNSPEDSLDGAEHISDVFGGVRVDRIYVADHGVSQNCIGVVLGKCGVTTGAVDAAVRGIRQMIEKVGGIGGDGLVLLIAFSQGGQVLSNALSRLSREESSMLGVATFGTAKIIADAGTRFAINYIAKNDYVPAISDPAMYMRAKAGLVPNVHFVNPVESGWFSHRFKSATYTEALRDFRDYLFTNGVL